MSLMRLLILFCLALVPLAVIREIWWSKLLFGRPWQRNGGGDTDFGVFADLLAAPFSYALTLIAGFAVALLVDSLMGVLGRATLAVLLLAAMACALVIKLLLPELGWMAFWPLSGYLMLAVTLVLAALKVGRLKV